MPPITVVETTVFKNKADGLLSDDDRLEIITYLASNPKCGRIIQGTGGVRKTRIARNNDGKSGGYRTIHYYHNDEIPLFALMIYSKNTKDSLSQNEKNELKKLVQELISNYYSR